MTIRIVTDSASDIRELAKEWNVKVVPLSVTIGNQSILEDANFDYEKFYAVFTEEKQEETEDKDQEIEEKSFFQSMKEKGMHFIDKLPSIPFLSSKQNLPKTSQPTPQSFYQTYVELIEEGATEIIVVTISAGLSGTLNSAKLAARQINRKWKEVKFYFVDSKSASYPATYLIKRGLDYIKQGLSAEEIAKRLQEEALNITTYIFLPTIKYIYLGGRISLTKYMLGRVFRKKPIIKTNAEGKLETVITVTDAHEGLEKLIELSTDNYTKKPRSCAIMYGIRDDYADYLEQFIRSKYPDLEIIKRHTGAVIASHTGPEAVGLICNFN
ncbi:MAG: DegV family protein [Candidatus Heimdallarchaeaceae archaeon]